MHSVKSRGKQGKSRNVACKMKRKYKRRKPFVASVPDTGQNSFAFIFKPFICK